MKVCGAGQGELDGFGQVIVDTDANLAAVAEQAVGAGRGIRSFAALLSGERVGAGPIIDGTLIRGRHGGAGEMRVPSLVEGVGSAAELAALTREWAHSARTSATVPETSTLFRLTDDAMTAEVVLASAAAGDQTSSDSVGRLGDRLARVCPVRASLLDIERVIVGGAIAVAAGPVIARARTVLGKDATLPRPEIVASPLGADAVVLGAIQRGLAMVRTDPLGFVPAVQVTSTVSAQFVI